MKDIVVDIADEVFVFNLTDYVSPGAKMLTPDVAYSNVTLEQVAMDPGVRTVKNAEEILLLRQAAMEALKNDSR